MVLVVIGSLLTGSFVKLLRTDIGFEPDRALASIIIPSGEQYVQAESRALLCGRVIDSVRALSGVESAGVADALPFSGENHGALIALDPAEVRPGGGHLAETDAVSSSYLQAMGIRLLQGRWFREEEEKASSPAALVSEAAASRWWPGESALGKRICVNPGDDQPPQWKQVGGVVQSVRHAALQEPIGGEVYFSGGSLDKANFLVLRPSPPQTSTLSN